jgi:hypothetical protein
MIAEKRSLSSALISRMATSVLSSTQREECDERDAAGHSRAVRWRRSGRAGHLRAAPGGASRARAYTAEPKKTSIHIVRITGFSGIHPRKRSLILNLRTAQPIQSARIAKVEQVSRNRYHNEISLSTRKQWIRKSSGGCRSIQARCVSGAGWRAIFHITARTPHGGRALDAGSLRVGSPPANEIAGYFRVDGHGLRPQRRNENNRDPVCLARRWLFHRSS